MYVLEDRQMYIFTPAQIATDMDELCYIRLNREHNWEATDKGRIIIEGVWDTSHMVSQPFRVERAFATEPSRLKIILFISNL